jgi:hypothetical protein
MLGTRMICMRTLPGHAPRVHTPLTSVRGACTASLSRDELTAARGGWAGREAEAETRGSWGDLGSAESKAASEAWLAGAR